MKIKILKDFNFAYAGIDVVAYLAGDEIEASDELIAGVPAEWIAVIEKAPATGATKATRAPRNKAQ